MNTISAGTSRPRQPQFVWHDDDDHHDEPEQTGAAGPAEEAMLMCMECEEEEADETANMSLECAECEEEVIDDSSAVPETARMTGHDAKKIPGNGVCFECDAALSHWEDPWISTSFGTLLCAGCAQQHRSHGAQPSIQRLPLTARLPAHVCALVARGGNAKMRKFLAGESIGVSPAIWRELPLELRYQTPAADLYRRRLHAELTGAPLPTEMTKLELPPEAPPCAKQVPPWVVPPSLGADAGFGFWDRLLSWRRMEALSISCQVA